MFKKGGKYMTITEFATSRGVSAQTVSIYMQRHKAAFDKHKQRDGKSVILDDVALQMLDKIYPVPAPVEVVEDVETMRQLIAAQQTIIQLQDTINKQMAEIADLQGTKLLADTLQSQCNNLQTQNDNLQVQNEQLQIQNSDLQIRNEQLQNDLTDIMNRSLIQRILNKAPVSHLSDC